MKLVVRRENANAPSKRDTQYFEMFGNRALYHNGWIAVTPPPQPPWLMGTVELPPLNEYKWELYTLPIVKGPQKDRDSARRSMMQFTSMRSKFGLNFSSSPWPRRVFMRLDHIASFIGNANYSCQ